MIQFENEIFQIAARGFTCHNFKHLFSNLSNLRRLCVCGFLNLVRSSFGKSNDKDSKKVTIGGLDVYMAFNKGLPFPDERSQFVGGD